MSSSGEDAVVLVADLPRVSPQSQTFGSLASDDASPTPPLALAPAGCTTTSDVPGQGSRSASPDFQHPEEFRPSGLSSPPSEPRSPSTSRPPAPLPIPIPEREREREDTDNTYMSPRSSRGEPVLTGFRPKPASGYVSADRQMPARSPPRYLQDSTGQSFSGEMETVARSFHDIDPAEIDFDTKQAYQSLGELAPPNKYEEVPPASAGGIYNTPRSFRGMHTCASHKKHSSILPTLACCSLLVAILALIFAVGGTSLAVYNLLETPDDTSSDVADLQKQLQASQAMVVILNDTLEELRQEILHLEAKYVSQLTELSHGLMSGEELVKEVSDQVKNVTMQVEDILDPGRSTRIQELRPYQNCTTSKISDCTIEMGLRGNPPSYAGCETARFSRNRDGRHNLDLHCVVVDTRGEEDPIITSLIVDENSDEVGCLCYVTAFSAGVDPVQCALYATRCPETFYLDTLIKL